MFAKIFGVGVASLLLVVASASGANPPNWVRVAPKGEHFQVSMPAEPKVTTQQKNVGVDILVKVFQADDLAQRVRFSVLYIESESFRDVGGDMVEEFMDQFQEEMIAGFDGQLLSSKKIDIQGNVGREIVALNPSNSVHLRARILLHGDRVYVIAVEGDSLAVVNNQTAGEYFGSFSLTVK